MFFSKGGGGAVAYVRHSLSVAFDLLLLRYIVVNVLLGSWAQIAVLVYYGFAAMAVLITTRL